MADTKKKPEECLHFSIARLKPEDKKTIVEINGKGWLKPGLRCDDCEVVFYTLESSKKPKEG